MKRSSLAAFWAPAAVDTLISFQPIKSRASRLKLGIGGEGLAKLSGRLLFLSLLPKNYSQIIVRRGELRIQTDRFCKFCPG